MTAVVTNAITTNMVKSRWRKNVRVVGNVEDDQFDKTTGVEKCAQEPARNASPAQSCAPR